MENCGTRMESRYFGQYFLGTVQCTTKPSPTQHPACLNPFLQPYGSAPICQATDRPALLMAHSAQPSTRSLPRCHAFSFPQPTHTPHAAHQLLSCAGHVGLIYPSRICNPLRLMRASWASWATETRTASRRSTAGRSIVLVRSAAATRLLTPAAPALLFETTAQAHLHLRLGGLWGVVSSTSTIIIEK